MNKCGVAKGDDWNCGFAAGDADCHSPSAHRLGNDKFLKVQKEREPYPSPLYFLRVAMPPRICRWALLMSSKVRTCL